MSSASPKEYLPSLFIFSFNKVKKKRKKSWTHCAFFAFEKLQVEEFYVITWDSPKEQIFEMPTGDAAIMRSSPNLLKLARKEQCLALGIVV